MKIAFNFHGCSAGNNGGTQSVFLSAIALDAMGHDVECWSHRPNKHTWIRLPKSVPFITKKSIHQHGPTDVLVALGAKSVKSTVAFKQKGQGVYWIRGYETWACSKANLVKGYRSGLLLAANSQWLCDRVSQLADSPCELIRPGIATDFFTPTARAKRKPVIVGALYSPRASKRSKFAANAVNRAGGMQLWLLGNQKPPKAFWHTRAFKQPSREGKRTMMQAVDIWLAPTISEGLHLPPMEAGLCGCALIANQHPRGGMEDYANKETAVLFPKDNMDAAILGLQQLAKNFKRRQQLAVRLREQIVKEIGTPTENMEKLVTWLE